MLLVDLPERLQSTPLRVGQLRRSVSIRLGGGRGHPQPLLVGLRPVRAEASSGRPSLVSTGFGPTLRQAGPAVALKAAATLPGMFVKICGVTNLDDALQAVEAGADAVGMVFAESPRRIEPATGESIVRSLPPETLSVAVFRNQPLDEIREILRVTRARGAQIHGPRPGGVR